MALFFADLVREFSSSTGAGDFVLNGPVPGHRRFAGVVPAGAHFHYCIAGVTHPAQWEVGEGEIGSGGALVRMPAASSAGGELVGFSPGLKTVALTVAADWFAAQEQVTPFARTLMADDTAGAARTTLGLGSLAVQEAGAAAITGGTIEGLARLGTSGAISSGGRMNAGAGLRVTGLAFSPGDTGPGLEFSYFPASGDSFLYSIDRTGDVPIPLEIGGSVIRFSVDDGLSAVGRFTRDGLAVAGRVEASAGINVGAAQVVGARRPGWEAPAGIAARGSFDTGSVTTAQLAERVKALIDDLAAHGLIGS